MKNKKEYTSFLEDNYDESEIQEETDKPKRKSTVLSRQTKLIVILAAFIVVMIPVYIFFVIPMLEQSQAVQPPQTDVAPKFELKYDEVSLSKGNTVGMRATFAVDELAKVTVKNKVSKKDSEGNVANAYQEWTMFPSTDGKSWAIEGYEGMSYDNNALITILAFFIQMEAEDKIEFSSWEDIDLATYGFDDESMPVKYTIKTTANKEYTVTVGDETPTKSGYYAYYTDENGEKRPTVYLISAQYGKFANCSMYDLVAPVVIQKLDQKDYVPETFSLYRGKEQYFNIKKFSDEELAESEAGKVSHLFTTIDGVDYEFDASADYSVLLYEKIQPGVDGTKVVYAKPDSDEFMSKEVLLSYGIDTENPHRQLFFRAKAVFAQGTSHAHDQTLVFSKKTLNENEVEVYYVFNMVYDTIVEVEASKVDFIEYDYTWFCEKYIVLFPFYNIDEITVDSTTLPDAYVASGMKSLIETFVIKASSDYQLTDAIIKSNGKTVPDVSEKITGLRNFGEWYNVILSLSTQTEIPSGVLENIDLEKPDITITMKTVGGKTHVMKFYLYNSRHAYYTFDGLGRSYIRYDDISNMLNSTYNLINGLQVNSGYTAAPDPTEQPSGSTNAPSTGGSASGNNPEQSDEGITTTEIVLIVVLCIVLAVGGGVVAYIVVKGKKAKSTAGKKK